MKKVRFYYFFIKQFLHTLCQKRTFCYPSTFIELLITYKRFIFEESYISYGKCQKSCTLIVVLVKCFYLMSPIFYSSAKSNRTFYLRSFIVLQTAFPGSFKYYTIGCFFRVLGRATKGFLNFIVLYVKVVPNISFSSTLKDAMIEYGSIEKKRCLVALKELR